MKKCFKCGNIIPLTDFYVHPQMADGHLNKCKYCTKKDVKNDYNKNIINPEWHQKEKTRGREKYHRLEYKGKYKQSFDARKMTVKLYKEKYPEKQLAKNGSQRVITPEGLEKHYWSYNKEHFKDVIFLSKNAHMAAHRYMIYDQERMMYRNLDGLLLDTKEIHENYIISCIEKL